MKYGFATLALATLCAAALTACSTTDMEQAQASAKLQPTNGSNVSGEVSFTQKPGGRVVMNALVRGLQPNSVHGFHVHENSSCDDNGNAAGGHFNPKKGEHGKYDAPMHHVGDLPSLKADSNGVAKLNMESKDLTLLAGPGNIIERSLIVHANPDDYVTQPAGNAGPRIACAIITRD